MTTATRTRRQRPPLIPGRGWIKITPFAGGEASGSELTNPAVASGYSPVLEDELVRVGTAGGWIQLDALAAKHLAEWADAMVYANEENMAGARAMRILRDKAYALAAELQS